MAGFEGFPRATLSFLAAISQHNDKAWFDAHRADYEAGYVAPAKAFVEALGPRLAEIAPNVRCEPRINGSIMRINRDTRFSANKLPYKDHLDIMFWHGERRGWEEPGFFVRITADAVWLGAGMHHFRGDVLTRYRDAVVDERSGSILADLVSRMQAAGYMVGSMPRKQVPRGYDKAHPRAALLLWEGLPAMARLPPEAALAGDFDEVALGHFRATWPIGQWLLDEVVS